MIEVFFHEEVHFIVFVKCRHIKFYQPETKAKCYRRTVLSGATVHSSGLQHLFTTAQEVSEVEMLKSIQQSVYM